MPVYEYLCEDCEGVFEAVRPMKESQEPEPCPVCDAEGERVMPSSFTAFVMRKGYPRRLPDRGTYWHLGQEVSYLPKQSKPNEHPQVKGRDRSTRPATKQDLVDMTDRKIAERRAKREEARAKRDLTKDAKQRRAKDRMPPHMIAGRPKPD